MPDDKPLVGDVDKRGRYFTRTAEKTDVKAPTQKDGESWEDFKKRLEAYNKKKAEATKAEPEMSLAEKAARARGQQKAKE